MYRPKIEDVKIYILSHGRADRVHTVRLLKRFNSKFDYRIICDNEDGTIDEYKKRYGERVYIFDKSKYIETVDTMDNFRKHNVVVYARNAVYDIANELGDKYMFVLDDDYTDFTNHLRPDKKYKIYDINKFILDYYEYLLCSDMWMLALCQGGEMMGRDRVVGSSKRKAMNAFFCRADRPVRFMGTINEDTNFYVNDGKIGRVIITPFFAGIEQIQTQQNPGGLTEEYISSGTYTKSFYTVMINPSAVKIFLMGISYKRYHHLVNWEYAVPKILRNASEVKP